MDERVVAALIGAVVVAIGWMVSLGRDFALDRHRRGEKAADLQRALAAEIAAHVHQLAGNKLGDHLADMTGRMERDPSFIVLVPRESHDTVYRALLSELYLLPGRAILPVVVFYNQIITISNLADDIRSERFEGIDAGRRIELYRHFIELKIAALSMGRAALAALSTGMPLARKSVAWLRPRPSRKKGRRHVLFFVHAQPPLRSRNRNSDPEASVQDDALFLACELAPSHGHGVDECIQLRRLYNALGAELLAAIQPDKHHGELAWRKTLPQIRSGCGVDDDDIVALCQIGARGLEAGKLLDEARIVLGGREDQDRARFPAMLRQGLTGACGHARLGQNGGGKGGNKDLSHGGSGRHFRVLSKTSASGRKGTTMTLPERPSPSRIAIAGAVRFSIFTNGRNGFQRGKEFSDEEMVAFLFDEQRMLSRFTLFECLTLPSLAAQTDGDFRLIALVRPICPTVGEAASKAWRAGTLFWRSSPSRRITP